jgi:hypothetical protein
MSSDPVLVNTISMPTNELYIQGGYTASSAPVATPPTSTAKFVAQEHRLLWDTYLMPMQDLAEEDAQSEVFALYTLQRHTKTQYQNHFQQPERFALTYIDLCGPNILSDNEFHITAVIDWEWAVMVPVTFFTPPLWITASKDRLTEFRSALAPLSSPAVAVLQEQWLSPDHELALHVAQVFQHPNRLAEVFRKLIYPCLSDRSMDEATREFFLSQQRQDELKQRIQNSERYTRYLKENNLYKLSDLQKWSRGTSFNG